MRCADCDREKPDSPCATVVAKKRGYLIDATVTDESGFVLGKIGDSRQEAFDAWVHEIAEEHKTNLHFHWA